MKHLSMCFIFSFLFTRFFSLSIFIIFWILFSSFAMLVALFGRLSKHISAHLNRDENFVFAAFLKHLNWNSMEFKFGAFRATFTLLKFKFEIKFYDSLFAILFLKKLKIRMSKLKLTLSVIYDYNNPVFRSFSSQ